MRTSWTDKEFKRITQITFGVTSVIAIMVLVIAFSI